MSRNKARVIAMYLPQYHPIPENDTVWGKGFTEWNNVAKARPLFRGHHQPNIPADLGFYDLRLPEVREQQAQLAKDAGVEGFMYWHYWFGNGKRLLERPFDEVLSSGKPDYPFCLGWANHSWKTSTWTTIHNFEPNHMICEQTYPGEEDFISHFNYCYKAFSDHRYIKVDGKPLFFIYDSLGIPNCKHFIELWNSLARDKGLLGIHFVGLSIGERLDYKLIEMGYNAIAHSGLWDAEAKVKSRLRKLIENTFRSIIDWVPLDRYEYKKIIKYLISDYDKQDNVYPCIIPGWDRSPRSGRRAVIYSGSTPSLWKKHINNAINAVSHKNEEQRIIILRSWNEWGEGNYVEPDERWGHGYLDALKESITSN